MENDDYFENSRNFENSKTAILQQSTRRAWYIAYGSLTLATLSVIAVVGLTPLKKVVPFVVRVDNATGIVDVVQTMKDSKTNYDEAVSKYFVRQFIKFREGYSPDKQVREEHYRNIGFMSSQAEQQKYFDYFNPNTNKNSPLNLYGNHGRINTIIKSISFVDTDKKVALVRFIREIDDGRETKQTHYAATVTFDYVDSGIEESVRAINPLGFQVKEYRVDADSDSDLTSNTKSSQ